MAKYKKLINLTQDALDELEALSANDTHRYNASSVLEALIHEAYAKAAQPQKPMKEIRYDRETRDYAMYLDGELVGFKKTHHDATIELDRLAFDTLQRT